jgi:hypothetical protein
MNLQATRKRAMLCLLADVTESIDDHSHEDIHEPEVEQDQTRYEEQAGYEILGIDHIVRPLSATSCGIKPAPLTSCDDYNLQESCKDIVEALRSIIRIIHAL